jgi:putative ABC transport system permease protein
VTGYLVGCLPIFLVRSLVTKVHLKLIVTPEMMLVVFIGTVLLCQAASIVSFKKVAATDPALVFRG